MINDLMFSNIVLKQDLINDKKGLESLPEIICCVLWHGPVTEFYNVFALYVHKQDEMYAVNLNLWKYYIYFSSNSSKILYFPVFPTLPKFGVFPRTVITTGNSHHRYLPANHDYSGGAKGMLASCFT